MPRIKHRTAYDPTKFMLVLRRVVNEPGFEGLIRTILFVKGQMKKSERVMAMCRPRQANEARVNKP